MNHRCIYCDCSDEDACKTPKGPCGWLVTDNERGTGVCTAPSCQVIWGETLALSLIYVRYACARLRAEQEKKAPAISAPEKRAPASAGAEPKKRRKK